MFPEGYSLFHDGEYVCSNLDLQVIMQMYHEHTAGADDDHEWQVMHLLVGPR